MGLFARALLSVALTVLVTILMKWLTQYLQKLIVKYCPMPDIDSLLDKFNELNNNETTPNDEVLESNLVESQ